MRRTTKRINPDSDEQLLTEIELLWDVREAEDQIAAGAVLSNRDAKAELRRRLRK